jgi:predicted MFS family arabinose efflux permease
VVVAAPLSIGRALFRASYIASVPTIVGRPQLARANGLMETVESSTIIIGPAIAGFLAFAIGPGLTLALDAVSFAVSAFALFFIHRSLRAPLGRPATRIVDDVREGIVYIARHPVLRTAILLFSLLSAVVAPFIVALAVRITRDLGQPDSVFGLVVTSFGVGAVGGSLLIARLGRRTNVALALLGGMAVEGAALALVGLVESVPAMMGLAVVAGLAESVVIVTYVTLRAANSPDVLLGRIGSTARVVTLGLQPIGLLVGGLLIDTIGGSQAIAIMGASLCVIALAFLPVRALRGASLAPPTPAAAPDLG